MTPFEQSLYALAERLHQPVFVIEQMPITELNGWFAYFQLQREEEKKAEAKRTGNIAQMDPNDIAQMFSGGGSE